MLIEQIRSATRSEHESLEQTLLPYIASIRSTKDYGRLLQAFNGYLFPVQERIMSFIDDEQVPDIAERRNARLLTDDLKALDQESNSVFCEDLPPISSFPEAVGALYVMEGSTLGGKIIARMISQKLGGNEGLQFFTGYGGNTGSMWKKFVDNLEHLQHPNHNGTIVESVRKTFSLFDKWLKEKLHTNDGEQPTAS